MTDRPKNDALVVEGGLRRLGRFPPVEDLPEILCALSLLDEAGAALLQSMVERHERPADELAVAGGFVTEERLMEALADFLGLPFRRIDPLALDAAVVTGILPHRFAQRHKIVTLHQDDQTLTIALGRPFDGVPLDDIVSMTGLGLRPVVSTPTDVERCIDYFYGLARSLSRAEAELAAPLVGRQNFEQLYLLENLADISPDAKPLVSAVNYLLHSALDQRASDIHFEPKRSETWVRLRIDGILHTVLRIQEGNASAAADGRVRQSKKLHSAIVSRLKTMAGLDIAERHVPQDGRMKLGHGQREIELRVSVMPVAFGEKVVLRIFDPDVLLQSLDELGFTDNEHRIYKEFLSHTNGIVLVTGPTGSGKTTTLYSTLRHLSSSAINVTTIEDPIELVYEDFNQVSIRPSRGMGFANALRTILRQDPDVIMVGEIRDLETAENAIQAALTGHLVFSTLHTNDAPSAITRLVDMGVPPFLIGSTLLGAVAQRLVRVVCRGCAETYRPGEEELARLGLQLEPHHRDQLRFRRGRGCPSCRQTGYLGRTGIFEVMRMTPGLRYLARDGADARELRRQAIREGMVTLRESALRKVAQGLTTVEEVQRITAEV